MSASRPLKPPRLFVFVVLGLALALLSCSDGGTEAQSASYPATPLAVVATDDGQLEVAARTSPSQPPPAGVCSVQLVVTDVSGAPVDGLSIATVPWMPTMGHGTSVVPTLSAEGGGVYVLSNVDLFMAGRWDLHLTLSGRSTSHALVTVEIP